MPQVSKIVFVIVFVGRWAGLLVGRYFFGQVMSPKLSDQMFQRSQVSGVALCMSKVKVRQSVSESVSE